MLSPTAEKILSLPQQTAPGGPPSGGKPTEMSQPRISKDSICAVVGYGSWATAIVKILLENGSTVRWHVRNPDVKAHLSLHRTNPKYLSQVHFFTDRLTVTDDIRSVVRDSDVIIFAVPSAFLGLTLEPLGKRHWTGNL